MKIYRSIPFKKAVPLTLLLLTLLSIQLLAQDRDHVYLKSGSVIRGRILEVDPMDHVKIEDMSGNLWFYKIAEVEKITSEPFESGRNQWQDPIGFDSGFVNMTSIGFLAGSPHNSQVAPFSLLTVTGYRTSYGLFAGVGTGIEFFSISYLPLFIDLRYELFGTDVVPYVMAKGGYGLPLTPVNREYDTTIDYSGGALLGLGVGLKIRTRSHFAWDFELLYRYQESSFTELNRWDNQENKYSDVFNRIEIRLGFYID
jgi:hypothetical protein